MPIEKTGVSAAEAGEAGIMSFGWAFLLYDSR